jgi:hypothetical protein
MGLHQDAAPFGLSPFEVEQRRRLWWTLVGYDRRIGEMTGSTVTALSSGGDCRLPLNINDNDLHVNGKDPPTPHTGPTEILFTLVQLELAMAVSTDSMRDSSRVAEKEPSSVPGTPRPAPTIRFVNQDSPNYTMDGFCAYIEDKYLKLCDPKIPLHFFTLTMTRQALCKMRVISFLVRLSSGDAGSLTEVERNTLFLEAIQMIEYDNIVQSAESLQGYKWFTYLHFPFPAYMFLVTELRQRTTGSMVERAWDAITENHERRRLMNNLHSPMHIAFGNLFIKAWDARDAAEQRLGKNIEAPRWIMFLRQRAEKLGKKHRWQQTSSRPGPDGAGPLGVPLKVNPDPNQVNPGVPGPPNPNTMTMTPPADPANPMAGGPPVPEQEFGDMDWSYLMQEYNMGGLSAFGGFGFPMGGPMGQPVPTVIQTAPVPVSPQDAASSGAASGSIYTGN